MSPRVLAVAGLLLLAAVPARCEVQLQKVQWQLSRKVQGRAPVYEDVSALALVGAKPSGKYRARLTLLARGPQPAEGILLRYSVAAKVAPKGRREDAAWAVPFMLDERRVPKVGPNQVQEVPLEPSLLALYLLKLSRAGFVPTEIKLQVMLWPRAGQTGAIQTLESVLPVNP